MAEPLRIDPKIYSAPVQPKPGPQSRVGTTQPGNFAETLAETQSIKIFEPCSKKAANPQYRPDRRRTHPLE